MRGRQDRHRGPQPRRPDPAALPGIPQRRSHDCRRHGTTDLFAALDTASGRVIASMTARHRSEEFRKFLNQIDSEVPDGLDIHIVLDNVSAHKTPAVQRRLVRHPRFTLHFTPTYSSWTNLVERWFAEPAAKWLKRGTHRSVAELRDSINHRIDNRNANPRPFTRHKTADDIFDTMTAYMQQTPHSRH